VAPNQQENTHFSTERGINNHEIGTGLLCISADKRVKLVDGRMSYIKQRGRWCHTIILKVHVPTVDKIDDTGAGSLRNWNMYSINSLIAT
jgi:hypothetical protein